jgi:hypothetical protein
MEKTETGTKGGKNPSIHPRFIRLIHTTRQKLSDFGSRVLTMYVNEGRNGLKLASHFWKKKKQDHNIVVGLMAYYKFKSAGMERWCGESKFVVWRRHYGREHISCEGKKILLSSCCRFIAIIAISITVMATIHIMNACPHNPNSVTRASIVTAIKMHDRRKCGGFISDDSICQKIKMIFPKKQ